MNKITIIGAGYVGMSLAVLLGQKNEVIIHDLDHEKVNKINNKQSSVSDKLIDDFLLTKQLNIVATTEKALAYGGSNFYIISTPTDFDDSSCNLDTSIVETVISDILKEDRSSFIIIKSTIPIGFTQKMRRKHNTQNICFSPEFLRESNALNDNLYPSRIIVGSKSRPAQDFADMLQEASKSESENIFLMTSSEAEAVKLFSNTYLAMRVAFFNEMDSFALDNNLNMGNLIKGVCADDRIGNFYNNPSFGYGGYCLPKDSKQLLSSYAKTPQSLIQATIDSNISRIEFITQSIAKRNLNSIGIFRLVMKKGSHNFRSSAMWSLVQRLQGAQAEIFIYEPLIEGETFQGIQVMKSLPEFIERSELIIANRNSKKLKDVQQKVFSRDIFGIS